MYTTHMAPKVIQLAALSSAFYVILAVAATAETQILQRYYHESTVSFYVTQIIPIVVGLAFLQTHTSHR